MKKKSNKGFKDVEMYQVSVSYVITTSGGKDMAKKIFSNIVKSDPNHPLVNVKTRYVTRANLNTRVDK